MFWTILLAGMVILAPMPAQGAIVAQDLSDASESGNARLYKASIISLMVQVGRMSILQQNQKIDNILENQSGSKTPRSDFLFCSGLAYLGDDRAQACLGSAFENGRGIVEDIREAYVWYSIALDNPNTEKAIRQKIQEDIDRVKKALRSTTPAPTEAELDDLVKTQKEQMILYIAEIRNTRL